MATFFYEQKLTTLVHKRLITKTIHSLHRTIDFHYI